MKRNNQNKLYIGHEMIIVLILITLILGMEAFQTFLLYMKLHSMNEAVIQYLVTQTELITKACYVLED